MKNLHLVFAAFFVLNGCSNSPDSHDGHVKTINLDSIKEVLKQTDLAFSNLSKEKGRNISFLEYMDENVTMLQANSIPLVGKDTMRSIYSVRADTAYTLTWTPLFADVSSSGDLGYTYGTWLLETKSGEKSEGTYATVWKEDSAGNWKFVLDTGNEGLRKPAE